MLPAVMIYFGVRQLSSENGNGRVCIWRTMGRTVGLVPYPREAVRELHADRILWSGLLDTQNWMLYSVVYEAMNCLLCFDWEAKQDPGPKNLIVWEPKVGQSVHLIPWSGEATGFALQIWEVMGCILFSSVNIFKTVK